MARVIKLIPNAIIPPECRERFLGRIGEANTALKSMGIELSGISELVYPYRIVRPAPGFHLVIYTLSGQARQETNEGIKDLKAGQVWVSPATHPQAYWVEKNQSWSIMWFHLADIDLWQFLDSRSPGTSHAQWVTPLKRTAEEFLVESLNPHPDSIKAFNALAELINVYLNRELGVDESPATLRSRQQLNTLWRQVNAQLNQPWSLKTLSEETHISPAHLFRLTARFHGTTPFGKVTQLRIQRSQDLLCHTDYPVKLIADLVGYGTQFAFSRTFHKFTGLSPSAFRNQHTQGSH